MKKLYSYIKDVKIVHERTEHITPMKLNFQSKFATVTTISH